MALRIRRGTSAQRTGITPVSGELIFDTTQNKLYVGNGSTAGGVEVVAGQIGGNLGSNINLNNFDITGTGNINITGTITASGTITGNGDLVLGNADTDNVQFGADINSNIVPNTGTLTVGTSTKPWQTVFASALENTSGITSNSSLTLNGLVTVGNNLVPNTTRTKDLGTTALRWKTVNAETLALENIQVTQNNIRTTETNSNINLAPNGTGFVTTSSSMIIGGSNLDIGPNTSSQIRISGDPASIYYNHDRVTNDFVSLTTSYVVNYTQLVNSASETVDIAEFDITSFNAAEITVHAINSAGTSLTKVLIQFAGTPIADDIGSSIISTDPISAYNFVQLSGNTYVLRATTSGSVNAGTITKFKVFTLAFRV